MQFEFKLLKLLSVCAVQPQIHYLGQQPWLPAPLSSSLCRLQSELWPLLHPTIRSHLASVGPHLSAQPQEKVQRENPGIYSLSFIMNKFTLKFTNQKYESEFQREMNQIYSSIFWLFSLGCSILILLNMTIQQIVNDEIYMLTTKICGLGYVLLQAMLAKKFSLIQKYGCIILSLLFQLMLINLRNMEQYHVFMAAQNTCFVYTILLIHYDFAPAMATNFAVLSIRLAQCLYFSEETHYFGLFYAVIVQLFVAICLYRKSKMHRLYFQLAKRDEQQNDIISFITPKPLFIFKYNSESLCFQEVRSVTRGLLGEIEKPLTYFLRNSKYKGVNLEQLLFRSITKEQKRRKNCNQRMVFTVQFESQELHVTLFQSYFDSLYCLLIDNEHEVEKQMKAYKVSLREGYQQKMWDFIESQKKMFKQIASSNSAVKLGRLRYKYTQLSLIKQMHETALFKINIGSFVRKLIMTHSQVFQGSITFEELDPVEIYACYHRFKFFTMELMRKVLRRRSVTQIKCLEYNSAPAIFISAAILFPRSKVFASISHTIVKTVVSRSGETIIMLYKSPLMRFQSTF